MPLICSVTCNESEKSCKDLIYVCKIYKVKIFHTLLRFLKITLFAVFFLNVDRFYNYCTSSRLPWPSCQNAQVCLEKWRLSFSPACGFIMAQIRKLRKEGMSGQSKPRDDPSGIDFFRTTELQCTMLRVEGRKMWRIAETGHMFALT